MTMTATLGDGWTVTRRNLFAMSRNPEVVVWSTIQPVMFIVLFVYVFDSIPTPGLDYVDYVMAGIFVQTVMFNSALTGVGLATDIQKGIIDRFRSLPMARSAVLVGRTTGDIVNGLAQLVVMVVVGFIVGWRTDASAPSVLAGLFLVLAIGYVFSWISATVGLSVGSVEVANSAGFVWMFPVTFVSSTFVDINSLNGVVRTIAEWNPMSAFVTAIRELFGNTSEEMPQPDVWPLQNPILATVLWLLVILAIFVPLSVRQYKKAASRSTRFTGAEWRGTTVGTPARTGDRSARLRRSAGESSATPNPGELHETPLAQDDDRIGRRRAHRSGRLVGIGDHRATRPAEPATTAPAGTEPAGTEPAGTEPAGTEPAGTEPAGTEPAGSAPAGDLISYDESATCGTDTNTSNVAKLEATDAHDVRADAVRARPGDPGQGCVLVAADRSERVPRGHRRPRQRPDRHRSLHARARGSGAARSCSRRTPTTGARRRCRRPPCSSGTRKAPSASCSSSRVQPTASTTSAPTTSSASRATPTCSSSHASR